VQRSVSVTVVEEERVLRNGKLYLLKSKGGVKKWKPVWAVLRAKSLAIYPNEQVMESRCLGAKCLVLIDL
jgi:hypothetical protein